MNQVVWGFHTLQNIFDQRVTEVGVGVIEQAIQQAEAEHNRQINALMSLFAEPTTDFKVRFRTVSGQGRLQPLDESGRALPRRVAGYYDLAFPLHLAGDAYGLTYLALQKATVGEIARMTSAMLVADARWMRDHILAALFANAAWTYTDPEHGALTIQGLANGDATTYQFLAGADNGATDNHYYAQAAAIADGADPFPTIRDELVEHPENGPDVLAIVPTNLAASVRALSGFYSVADPNLRAGANITELVGSLGAAVPGEIIGYHDAKVWIAEWRSAPSDYIIAVNIGGERPLRMRQEPEAQLQGFRQVAERNDHPWYERQWQRIAGFGAWNRVGGLVYRIGNAAYAIPAGYSSPMA